MQRVYFCLCVCARGCVRRACTRARARGGGGACSGLRTERRQCRRDPGKYPALRRHHACIGVRGPRGAVRTLRRARGEKRAHERERGKKGEEFGYEVREKESERIPCLERNKKISNNSCKVAKYSHDAKVAQAL